MAGLGLDPEEFDLKKMIEDANELAEEQSLATTPMQPDIMPLMQVSQREPSEKEIQALLHKKLMQSFSGQEKEIGRIEQEQSKENAREASRGVLDKIDLRPFMGAAKFFGASNAPEVQAPEDRTEIRAKLRQELGKARSGLTDDETSYLKTLLRNSGGSNTAQSIGSQRLALTQDRTDRNEHMKMVGAAKSDKILNDYGGKIQSIARANVLLDKAKLVTTASVEEYQQNLRAALTNIKGTGGVNERADTMIHMMDLDIAKLKQKFGDLDSVPKDHPLLTHLRDLGEEATKVLDDQWSNRLNVVQAGRKSLYNRRPDLSADYDDLKDSMKMSVMGSPEEGAADETSPLGFSMDVIKKERERRKTKK